MLFFLIFFLSSFSPSLFSLLLPLPPLLSCLFLSLQIHITLTISSLLLGLISFFCWYKEELRAFSFFFFFQHSFLHSFLYTLLHLSFSITRHSFHSVIFPLQLLLILVILFSVLLSLVYRCYSNHLQSCLFTKSRPLIHPRLASTSICNRLLRPWVPRASRLN